MKFYGVPFSISLTVADKSIQIETQMIQVPKNLLDCPVLNNDTKYLELTLNEFSSIPRFEDNQGCKI
jgi:hypothetical protein